MNEYRQKIQKWLSNNRPKGTRLLKQLIQEKSIQGHEGSSQAIIIEKCREMGLEIDIWEPGGPALLNHPYFVSPREKFKGSPNVIAVMKGSGAGRSIILNGHIDVVPEGDPEQWQFEPFAGEEVDGKVFGRGSTDMKGGNVALLLAMEAIISAEIKLKGDVIFQSVIEEESGGAGSLAAILKGYKADGVIIPEPTNMKIFPRQQGSMWFRCIVEGRSAHGGTRYQGVSAIDKAIRVIRHIEKLEMRRNARINDPLYKDIPIPIPINIGKITGGTWPSSVPDQIVLEGRIGVGPDEKLEDVKEEFASWMASISKQDSWFVDHPVKVEWFGAQWVPGKIDLSHDLMKSLSSVYREVKEKNPVIEASPWGTDGGLFTKIGNMPTVVFGPGVTEVAHYPNEYIVLDTLFEYAEILALTLIDWCGVENDS